MTRAWAEVFIYMGLGLTTGGLFAQWGLNVAIIFVGLVMVTRGIFGLAFVRRRKADFER